MRDSNEALEALALLDALPDEQAAALTELLASDPSLAKSFRHWKAVRERVAGEMTEDMPDDELLVLHVLADADLADLTDAETRRLDGTHAQIDAVLAARPSVAAAVERIRADRDAFEAEWSRHLAPDVEQPALRSRAAAERPAAADRFSARPARTKRFRWVSRVAVFAAFVAFGSILFFLAQREAGFQTITADAAQSIVLADGSTADLAAGTIIEVPEADGGKSIRQARLVSGRALFRINHDPAAPFTVTTNQAEITVLGTVFGVTTTQMATDVVLVAGAVTLAPRERPDVAVLLTPGQQSRVIALDAAESPTTANIGAALNWTGTVFARDEASREVAKRIAERFQVEVVVDKALAGEPVSGEFAGADGAEDALKKLALALGGRVDRTPSGFRIVEAAR